MPNFFAFAAMAFLSLRVVCTTILSTAIAAIFFSV
jgi:hypothetical protein